jgi:hypothetical protein
MVPPKSDPRWIKFVTNKGGILTTNLPLRMLMNRMRLKIMFDGSEASKQQAISEAYDFFVKNEAAVQEDIKLIFG